MGRLLEGGRVVPRNAPLAKRWMTLAARRGSGPARLELTPTLAEAGRLAASFGDDPGRAMTAWYPEPVPKTYKAALTDYVATLKAAKIGKFASKNGVNTTFMLGGSVDQLTPAQLEGLAREAHLSPAYLAYWLEIQKLESQAAQSPSPTVRFKLNRQAAEKASPSAMLAIAEALRDGKGVKADRVAAIQWATLAEAIGREKGPEIAASPAERAAGEQAATAWWSKRYGVSLAP
jgi:TPR repeat protein